MGTRKERPGGYSSAGSQAIGLVPAQLFFAI